MASALIDALVALSRELGAPENSFVILAEGNTSATIDDDRLLVKASGASLRQVTPASFLEVSISATLSLLDTASDERDEMDLTSCVVGESVLRPSVETPLHAIAARYGGARVVAHTHPTSVNTILCSRHATKLTQPLFPEQVVVCGPEPLFLPYVAPGPRLAHALREALRDRTEQPPRTIYVQNHGLIALGQSTEDVLQITQMASKAAMILAGALSIGGAVFLTKEQADAIDGRSDENYRRTALAGQR